ncbi:MAG TPA: hypothetical protein VFU31_24950 [Candidatus Binatia bacterium]|nr:hypothetical protein [Candidatus Binatia bacterium]
MRLAFYDFSTSPYSWDFLSFLVCARAAGANHVVFVPGERQYQKLTKEQRDYRLKHLLIPLCEEYTLCETREQARELCKGEVFPNGYTVENVKERHMLGYVVRLGAMYPQPVKRGAEIRVKDWLRGEPPVTITIRESPIRPERNSNIPAWIKAAEWMEKKGLNVVFIPDTEGQVQEFGKFRVCKEAARGVNFRIALYDAAALNLGIANGPPMACFYSYRPLLMFKPLIEGHWECSADYWVKQGIPPGVQPHWFTNAQRIVWFPDEAEVIVQYVHKWGKVQAGKERWEDFQYPVYHYPPKPSNVAELKAA